MDKIQEEYEKLIAYFDLKYSESDLLRDHMEQHPDVLPLEDTDVSVKTSFCYQFNLLAKRNFLNILRLPQTSYVKLAVTVLTATFAVILFYQSGTYNSNQGMQNIQGSLFFITMNISFNAIQNVILIFPDERPVFLREANNNMYLSLIHI